MKIYQILPEAQASALAESAKKLEWKEGKARTGDLTGTVKRNSEILHHTSLDMLGKRILNNAEIQLDCIPLKMHAPKFSRYVSGQSYMAHTDAPWMGQTRTDLSVTLWLNDDYSGGELVVDGESYKGKAGECAVYNCGSVHEVRPVTSGERIAVVTWIQSRIRDVSKRTLITDFRKFLKRFETSDPEAFLEGGRVYSALLRSWVET